MHRSGSTSRTSDEFVIKVSPTSALKVPPPKTYNTTAISSSTDVQDNDDDIPLWNNRSSKKESHDTSTHFTSERAVHLIPLVVFLSFFILWIFSSPDDMTLVNEAKSLAGEEVQHTLIKETHESTAETAEIDSQSHLAKAQIEEFGLQLQSNESAGEVQEFEHQVQKETPRNEESKVHLHIDEVEPYEPGVGLSVVETKKIEESSTSTATTTDIEQTATDEEVLPKSIAKEGTSRQPVGSKDVSDGNDDEDSIALIIKD